MARDGMKSAGRSRRGRTPLAELLFMERHGPIVSDVASTSGRSPRPSLRVFFRSFFLFFPPVLFRAFSGTEETPNFF